MIVHLLLPLLLPLAPHALGAPAWANPAPGALLAAADTYPRQSGVDAQHYRYRLTLSDDSDEIVGEATIDVRFTSTGVRELVLDLTTVRAGKGMTVSAVTSPQGALRYEHANDRLRITWTNPAAAGERRLAVVQYRGVPASGLRIGN